MDVPIDLNFADHYQIVLDSYVDWDRLVLVVLEDSTSRIVLAVDDESDHLLEKYLPVVAVVVVEKKMSMSFVDVVDCTLDLLVD